MASGEVKTTDAGSQLPGVPSACWPGVSLGSSGTVTVASCGVVVVSGCATGAGRTVTVSVAVSVVPFSSVISYSTAGVVPV